MVAQIMLSAQGSYGPDTLADELCGEVAHRAEVHQASGMVVVQLGVSVGEALVRRRAHAFAIDRPLSVVAGDVVARRLRLGR